MEELLSFGSPTLLGLILLLGFFVASLAMLPFAVLAVGTGAAFGVAGIPLASAFMASASLAHLILLRSAAGARLRPWFLDRLGHVRSVRAMDQVLADLDWRMIALIRLAPGPGGLVTYLFGLSRTDVRSFLVGTIVGSFLPLGFWVVVGSLGRDALDRDVENWRLALLVVGLAALGMSLTLVGRRVRTALATMGLELEGTRQ